ncbi:MAG: DNA polymerase alpha catalytic subunit, partial [Paramarteilia canceri]
MNFDVIYGDTDSIMLNTKTKNIDEAIKSGLFLKSNINRIYKKLEIGIDNIFRKMLLIKKKKYAALNLIKNPIDGSYSVNQELKGLDIVRRDWSQVAKKLGKSIIDRILTENTEEFLAREVLDLIENCAKKINQSQFDVDEYKIIM